MSVPESLKKSIVAVVVECAPSIVTPEVDRMFQNVCGPALDKKFDKERNVLETFVVIKIKEIVNDMIDKKIEDAIAKAIKSKEQSLHMQLEQKPLEVKKSRVIARKKMEDL